MFALGSLADDYGFDCFVHEVHAMMTNTTKPIIYLSNDVPDTKAICEMAAVIAGGWDRLRERPFLLQYDEVLSPLKHKNHAFDKFMYLAEQGLPIRYGAFTMSGASSPVTLPGAAAQSLAEALVGLMACQLKRPGVPYVMAILPGIMDLKYGILSSGAPEYHLFHAVYTELVHELGLPVMATGESPTRRSWMPRPVRRRCGATCARHWSAATSTSARAAWSPTSSEASSTWCSATS